MDNSQQIVIQPGAGAIVFNHSMPKGKIRPSLNFEMISNELGCKK